MSGSNQVRLNRELNMRMGVHDTGEYPIDMRTGVKEESDNSSVLCGI